MPHNRLLAQIDEELLQAQESLKFWREILLLDDSQFQVAAKRQIMHREAEIRRLLETHEQLLSMVRADRPSTASVPEGRPSASR